MLTIYRTKSGNPQLASTGIQSNLLDSSCDVLFIYDCCYASRYEIRGSPIYQGSKEVLAACSMEDQTTSVQNNSFTRRLIEELQKSQKDREEYISAWQLHDRLMGRKSEGDLKYTPRFFSFNKGVKPCINLIPMKRSFSHDSSQSHLTPRNRIGSVEDVPSLVSSETASTSNDWFTSDRRILVSINLEDTTKLPPFMQWKHWLTKEAPENIKSMELFLSQAHTHQSRTTSTMPADRPDVLAHIDGTYYPGQRFVNQFPITSESVFMSDSTLLLLSLPLPLWKYLQHDPKYRFVGLIRSQNLLHRKRLSRSPSISEKVEEGLSKASQHWWWYKWYLGLLLVGLSWNLLTASHSNMLGVVLPALFSIAMSALPPCGLIAMESSSGGLTYANWSSGTQIRLEPEVFY